MLIKQYLLTLIKKQRALFIAMALMSALSFSIFVGLSYSDNNYRISMDNYFNDYNYPSAFITTDFTNKEAFDCLNSVDGLNDFDVRFSSLFNINVKGDYLNVVLSTYKQDDFTKFAYMSDYVPGNNNLEILVDQQFADANNIKVGDTVTLGKKGHFCTCTVSQIVLRPENFCVYALGSVPIDNIGYGAAFIKDEDLEYFFNSIEIDNLGLDTNQALLDIDPSYDKQEVLDKCCEELLNTNNPKIIEEQVQEETPNEIDFELLEQYGINLEGVFTGVDSSLYNQTDFEEYNDEGFNKFNIISSLIDDETPPILLRNELVAQFSALTGSIPLAFLLIMSLVFILFLIQIIKKQSREIGVFLSMGYDKKSVYGLFATFTLLINVLSIFVGIALSFIIGGVSYSLYKSSVYIPAWTNEISIKRALISSVIVVVTGQLACAISSATFAKSSPMDALDKNYQNYIVFGEKIERIAYRIPSAIRLALNSIIQNSRNFIVIVLGFVASFVLTFSSISMSASMQKYINYTYDIQRNYDVHVVSSLGAPKNIVDELKECEYVTQLQTFNSINTDVVYEGKSRSITLIDFPNDNDMFQFNDVKTGERLLIPERGIILDKLTAEALGAEVGSKVIVCDRKFEVMAITNMYCKQCCVISIEEMKRIEKDKAINAIVNITNKKDFEKFCAFSENELYPIFSSNFKQMEISFKKAINATVNIAIVISVLLGFVVVCTVSLMTLEKQKRVISILRAQGFSLFAVSNYWAIQMVIQLVVAFLIGRPIATVAAKMFLSTLASDASYYPFVNELSVYIESFSFIIIFSIATHLVIMFFVSRFNLAQNVQSRE